MGNSHETTGTPSVAPDNQHTTGANIPRLGIKNMLGKLFGVDTGYKFVELALGKKVASLNISAGDTDSQMLIIVFDDGSGIVIQDHQECCEERWMHTDDKLSDYVGSTFLGIEKVPCSEVQMNEDEEPTEIEFLNIKTSVGVLTIVNHNSPNGYYGGFSVTVKPMAARVGANT